MPTDHRRGTAGARAGRGRRRPHRAVLLALPSALVLAVGLTSPGARAEAHPDNPFQDGPCVEVDDSSGAVPPPPAQQWGGSEEEPRDASDDEVEQEEQDEPDGEGRGEEREPDSEAAEPETGELAETEPGGGQDKPEGTGAGAGMESGEETEAERHPLDPLGIGPALRGIGQGVVDLFTPGQEEPETEEGEADAAIPPADDEAADPPAAEDTGRDSDSGSGPPTAGEEAEEAGEAEGESTSEADDRTEDDRTEDDRTEGDADDGADPFAPDADGKVPFPCPQQERVAGTDEGLPHALPDDPWFLDATYLTLRGLSYHGVVNVTTADGRSKQALKFTADELDIGDLHQIVQGGGGLRYHVQAAAGSASTFRDGAVTMYTEKLEGKLFGLIPVTFDPEHPPPLDLPFIHFTDVLVTQAAQFGGTLTMPGMRQYTTYE